LEPQAQLVVLAARALLVQQGQQAHKAFKALLDQQVQQEAMVAMDPLARQAMHLQLLAQLVQ
jgi:hypothetical protein